MKFGIFFRSTAGYLTVLFLLGASNVYAILKLVQFNTTTLRSLAADIRVLDVEKSLVDSLFVQQRYEQKYFITRDGVLYDQFIAAREDFDRHLGELGSISLTPAKKDSLEKIKAAYERYQTLIAAEVNYLKTQRSYDRIRQRAEKDKASDAVLEELAALDTASRTDVYNRTVAAEEAGAAARKVAVASFLITILLAVGLSFFITRGITNPLDKLVKKTREIPTGLFQCDLDVSSPPEILELTLAFNLMCERLKEVDKLKADFFAMISHELRTPLTTIQEGSILLLEGAGGAMTEKQKKLLTIISAESKRLASLVNSILDLSKMEAGMLTYAFALGSVKPLIDQTMMEIAPYAEAKRIVLEKRISEDAPLCLMDEQRILDVLRNLIANAIKFTLEEGRVTVAAGPGNGGLEVSVSDTGPGIPGEKLAAIFEKFRSTDEKKGTGLGLAIVKHIIAAHGGKVWAESKPGEGSRFIFVLPC